MHPEYSQTDIYLFFPSLHPWHPLPFVLVTVFSCFVQVCYDHTHTAETFIEQTQKVKGQFRPVWKRANTHSFRVRWCVWRRLRLPAAESAATSRAFPGSLRWARLRREKEPPLETIPPIKNQLGKQRCSAWQGRAAQVNKSVTTDGFSYSTNQLVF